MDRASGDKTDFRRTNERASLRAVGSLALRNGRVWQAAPQLDTGDGAEKSSESHKRSTPRVPTPTRPKVRHRARSVSDRERTTIRVTLPLDATQRLKK
ncbi:hypothetical protein AAFF_G00275280 [Aldrovandia affinis]|uniref:Uncharacterized protein n=1 Tax=Aldrovandia affinis TaxID=143900 RepID=A0AAD7SS65_9TELE|nr:hypothetical protein AAFF_G00275280 [Aldrovandia affinis]